MTSFDDEGDALIASVLEDSENPENPEPKTEFGSLLDTKWPDLINHPDFIGSQFMVTAFSLDEDCIYFKATADNVQRNRIGKTLITFRDATQIDSQKRLTTVTIAVDDIFSAVHLPMYSEEQNQLEMSVEHELASVTEQDFFDFEPQRTSTMEKQQSSQIDIPLLSTGHIDLYELHRLYKASDQNISFVKWREQQGVTTFQKEHQVTFSVPISIHNMGPTSKEAKKAKETWESTHSQHGLQFDDWFLIMGQETVESSQDHSTLSKIFRENDIDFNISPPQRPTCARCPPSSQCMFCTEETPSFDNKDEEEQQDENGQQELTQETSQSIIPNSQQQQSFMNASLEDLIQLSEPNESDQSSIQVIPEDSQRSDREKESATAPLSTTMDSEYNKRLFKKAYEPSSMLFKQVQAEKRRRANQHFFEIQEKDVQDKIRADYDKIQQDRRFFQIGFFQHHCTTTYPEVVFKIPSEAFPTDEVLLIKAPETAGEKEIKMMLDANEQTTWSFIRDISITPEDFLPKGRLAMIYIPTYAYIPGYCVHKLGLKPYRMQSYARFLLWQKLNVARKAAQQLITYDMVEHIKVTTWTLHLFNRIYGHAENGPNHTHLIDILQHHEALQLNEKYELHPIDVYDTLFRPLERLVAKGTKLHYSLIEARFDMKSRTHIYTKLIEIIQMGFNYKLNISPHEIYKNLSFIRQLAYEDLAHHSQHGFAPIQTLLPLDPFESDPHEKPMPARLMREVEGIIKEALCNGRFPDYKMSLPLAPGFLAEFPMIGGINMTVNWMKFVVETHNDISKHLSYHQQQRDRQERKGQLSQWRSQPKQHQSTRQDRRELKTQEEEEEWTDQEGSEGSQNKKIPHKRLTIYMPEFTRKDLEEEEEASTPQAGSYAATLKQRQNRVPIPLRRPNPSTEMKIFSLLK